MTINAQNAWNTRVFNIFIKGSNNVSFDINEIDSVKFSAETNDYSFCTDYVLKYDNLSTIISSIQSGDQKEKLLSCKYVDYILKNYNSYERIKENPVLTSVISLSDDDTIDPLLDGSFINGRTGGFFSALYPLAASLNIPVTEAVEGHRCGLNAGKLTTAGSFARLLAQHAGWELANHTMDARYGGALLVESFSDIPSEDKIPSPKGFLTYKKYVYVKDENRCYYYTTNGWKPVEEHKEPPYLMDSSGKAIANNPCFDFEYEVWKNQEMMDSLMDFRPVTYVQPVNQSSRKRAEYVKASHKYMMNQYSNHYIDTPLATTIGRFTLDDAEGTTNKASDELYESWKDALNDVLNNNKSIVLLLHTYRSCWSNLIEEELVSNGGTYPDEWVYPTQLPSWFLVRNRCARLQESYFEDYVSSDNYDCIIVQISKGIKKLALQGGKSNGFFFFDSKTFSQKTFLSYNKDGRVPDNACFAICNLKKADNLAGLDSIKMKYYIPPTLSYCARIVPDGTYSKFRDYVPSSNYDCLHVKFSIPVSKLELTGANADGYFYFDSSDYDESSFLGYNKNGVVPSGATYAIINFKKENNPYGYGNLLLEEVADTNSADWIKPSESSKLKAWSEWHPCPGTRLYQLWKFLKYARTCGANFLTIEQNLERMENKVEGGYYVRTKQNDFDEPDSDYYIEDKFGNIYLHRKTEK